MTDSPVFRVVLVADSPDVVCAVRASLGAPHVAGVHPFGAVSDGTGPSDGLAAAIAEADAVLVEWDLLRASVVGSLSARGRTERAPLVAVGVGGAGEHAPALAVGADRFHALPLDGTLLRAQVAAHRRAGMPSRPSKTPAWAADRPATAGPLVIDWRGRQARVGDSAIPLTPRQFDVLAFFVAHPDELIAREDVLEGIWGYTFDTGTNLVDVYVHHLRRRLAARGMADPFHAVRGRGYRFAVGAPGPAA